MERVAEERRHVGLLDDLAGVHDRHAVAHLGDDAEVVGDQDDRRPGLVAQVAHQVEDLGLDRHVERGRRLVGDEQLGLAGEGHRDHHALRHAARQLVREGLQAPLRVGDADHPEQLERARLGDLALDVAMDLQDLFDLLTDVPDRVERRGRLLEDHRDPVAADLAHLFGREGQQVAAVEDDLAGLDAARAWRRAA